MAAADSLGRITVQFARGRADYPSCEGIEVIADNAAYIYVTPTRVAVNDTVQLTATAYDGAGYQITPQPVYTWSKFAGVGAISPDGLFTVGSDTGQSIIQVSGSLYGVYDLSPYAYIKVGN